MSEFIPGYEKIYNTVNKIANLVIINVLWIVCCIPIVTAGAATSALYRVTFKMVDDTEGSHITKDFFRAFKENFNCATRVWMVSVVIGCILSVNIYIVNTLAFHYKNVILFLLFLLIFIFCIFEIYIYPIISNFKDNLKTKMTNALFMSLANLPISAFILCISIIPAIMIAFYAEQVVVLVIFYQMIGYSFAAYVNTKLFKKIYRKYIH